MPKPRKRKQANPFEKAFGINGTTPAFANDMFTNGAARMGFGTPSLGQSAEYTMVRISFDYWQLITLFRNHWISRRIVEVPAQDMVKAWPRLTSDIEPKDVTRIDRALRKTNTKNNVLTGLTWGRLFGGAGALIVIDGQENELDQPLDLDSVKIGAYKGIIPFDRWAGISPVGDVCTDINRPLDFNKPETYEVHITGGSSFKVHSSRLLRFLGPTVPTPEVEAQSYWGISVLEPTYESITMMDNMLWNILSLSFRANLLGMKFPELAQLLSGIGSSQVASQKFEQRMSAINHLMSNNSLIPLPAEGGIESTSYSFGGLGEVLQLFQLNLAGAAQMPVTRLFGRTYNGLGQAGDGDERIYEEKIATDQASYMLPQMEKLYPVVCMSELGEVPDDLDLVFPSIRVLDEKEKAELAKAVADTVTVYMNGGIMSPRRVAQEVKQSSDITGIGTNLDDEYIAKLSDDVQSEGELGEGLFGEEGGLSPTSSPEKVVKEENKEEIIKKAGEAKSTAPAMDVAPAGLWVGEKILVNGKLLEVKKVTTGTTDLFGEPTVQVQFTTGEVVAYKPNADIRVTKTRGEDAVDKLPYKVSNPRSASSVSQMGAGKRLTSSDGKRWAISFNKKRALANHMYDVVETWTLKQRDEDGKVITVDTDRSEEEAEKFVGARATDGARFTGSSKGYPYKGYEIKFNNGVFWVKKDGVKVTGGEFAIERKARAFVDVLVGEVSSEACQYCEGIGKLGNQQCGWCKGSGQASTSVRKTVEKVLGRDEDGASSHTARSQAMQEYHALPVRVESRQGDARTGVTSAGKSWRTIMPADYGFIEGVLGADGDSLDCYIGNSPESNNVYVVDQYDLDGKKFDEHKVMLGYHTQEAALEDYMLGHHLSKTTFAAITPFTVPMFRRWMATHSMSNPCSTEL